MAVYTEVSDEALRAFLAEYDIGALRSVKGIAEGVENSNYLLMTEQAPFILTLYEKRVDPADLPFFLGLMEHLSNRGVTCPLPVHRRDGAVVGELAGRPAAIITFLDGAWPKQPAVQHSAPLGAALAQLHLAGQDFALSRENALTLKDWRPLYDRSANGMDSVLPGMDALFLADLAFLEQNWPKSLPAGVIHADLFPDNVFFVDGRLSGLIDFYFACNDFWAYDLAICLNAWCFSGDGTRYDQAMAQALLDGYQSVRPLEDLERSALPVLAHGSAMRFALTRLYDWINTPAGSLVTKKDPRDYTARMAFHRGKTTLADYGLSG